MALRKGKPFRTSGGKAAGTKLLEDSLKDIIDSALTRAPSYKLAQPSRNMN